MNLKKPDAVIFDLEGTLQMPTLINSSGKISGPQLYKGAPEAVIDLSKRFPLFIVSNCHPRMLNNFLALPTMKGLFQDWTCYGETGLTKGQNIISIIKRNNLKSPIYIGDSVGDFIATQEAQIPFLFIRHGEKTDSPNYPTFSDFGGVVDYIKKLESN